MSIKKFIKNIPIVGAIAIKLKRKVVPIKFESTEQYWIDRYKNGGNSGQGSYNEFAEHKADVINDFVAKNNIKSVIEFGCGDGNQLKYFNFHSYIGYEISLPAVEMCKEMYKNDLSKTFYHLPEYRKQKVDLTLSLDVIYCLVEEDIYTDYLEKLFDSSNKFVLVFSSNHTDNKAMYPHMKHRKFTDWVEKNRAEFELVSFVKNKFSNLADVQVSDFYFFKLKEN